MTTSPVQTLTTVGVLLHRARAEISPAIESHHVTYAVRKTGVKHSLAGRFRVFADRDVDSVLDELRKLHANKA